MNRKNHHVLGFALGVALLVSACVSNKTYGDRAFEEGSYNEALDYYEEGIKEGDQDPELYHRAARASIAIGSFSAAERYYSQALRYGAGIEVARELGSFYIKTSNYASAVRVFQYLLKEETGDKRPIYNDLGTALMYAGRPFDAESYLMISQQMAPDAPLSYLNLGLLYDRYLNQPWLAVNFYQCFTKLGAKSNLNTEKAQQRVRELLKEWSQLYREEALICGEAYSPLPGKHVADLGKALEDAGNTPSEPKSIEVGNPLAPVGDVVVERMVEDPLTMVEEPSKATPNTDANIRSAREAFKKKNYAKAEAAYSLCPVANLSRADKRDLGHALLKLNRPAEATSWLELSMNDREDPDTLIYLIQAYKSSKQLERVNAICVKYQDRSEFKTATKTCPTAPKSGKE